MKDSPKPPKSTAARYRTGPSAAHVAHDEYSDSLPIACYRCDWKGTAGAASQEYFEALFDVRCPECDTMLLIVPYPTTRG